MYQLLARPTPIRFITFTQQHASSNSTSNQIIAWISFSRNTWNGVRNIVQNLIENWAQWFVVPCVASIRHAEYCVKRRSRTACKQRFSFRISKSTRECDRKGLPAIYIVRRIWCSNILLIRFGTIAHKTRIKYDFGEWESSNKIE